jgi:hypothetical protein
MSPKVKLSDIFHDMNKKTFTLSAILLASSLLLTGCTPTQEPVPKPSPTQVKLSDTAKESIVSNTSILIGTTNFENGITINTYQDAYGYPSEKQMLYFASAALPAEERDANENQPDTTEELTEIPSEETSENSENDKTFSNSPLIKEQRVVALRYEVTNTSESAVNVRIFTNTLGFFYEPTEIAPIGYADISEDSLHGKIGIPSYPANFNPESEEWLLGSQESATWGVDWLIPTKLLSEKEVTLIQNFSIGNEWVNGVSLPIKVDGIQ